MPLSPCSLLSYLCAHIHIPLFFCYEDTAMSDMFSGLETSKDNGFDFSTPPGAFSSPGSPLSDTIAPSSPRGLSSPPQQAGMSNVSVVPPSRSTILASPHVSPVTGAAIAGTRPPPTNFPPSRGGGLLSLSASKTTSARPTNSASAPMVSTARCCTKRKRKTIQRKRQEQQARLEMLTSQQRDLKEMVRVASAEVNLARRTLYNVLKTARTGSNASQCHSTSPIDLAFDGSPQSEQ